PRRKMQDRPVGSTVFRRSVLVLGMTSAGACNLTEDIRTRPGAPGEVPIFGDGGSDSGPSNSGGASGLDGGGQGGRAASGAGGGAGHGGAGGRLHAGGT